MLAGQFHAETVGTGVYAHPTGHRGLREAVARQIGISRGVQASPDDIVITNGTQQALDLIARVLLVPSDRVAVEDPGYEPPWRLFQSLGARVQGVPIDRQGLIVDALRRGTRLGFLVTPPSLREAVHAAKYVTDWHTSLPGQATLARFIDDGWFARHIRKMRAIYQTRHELVTSILARDFAGLLDVIPTSVGLHVSALAPCASTEQIDAVFDRARDAGVALHRLSAFAVDQPASPGLVLGYGAIPTERIEEGLRRLRTCFDWYDRPCGGIAATGVGGDWR